MLYRIFTTLGYISLVCGVILPGQNAYLPPKRTGYVYDKPTLSKIADDVSSSAPSSSPNLQTPTSTIGSSGLQSLSPTRSTGSQFTKPTYDTRLPQSTSHASKPYSSLVPTPIYEHFNSLPSAGPTYESLKPQQSIGSDYGTPPFGNVRPSSTSYKPSDNELPRPGTPPAFLNDYEHHHHHPGMPFDFKYAVNEPQYLNDFSHNAISDGDVTKGEYRVQLPDGRTQVVKYTADWKSGYHAQIRYEGQLNYQSFRSTLPTGVYP